MPHTKAESTPGKCDPCEGTNKGGVLLQSTQLPGDALRAPVTALATHVPFNRALEERPRHAADYHCDEEASI